MVFSDADVVDENLSPLDRRMWDEVSFDAHKKKLVQLGRAIEVLITGWTVTGATMAFRSQFVKLALPVPDGIAMIHDGWIALAIAAVADVVLIEEPLIKYRQHARQQIGAPARERDETEKGGRLQAFETAIRRRNTSADLYKTLVTLEERLTSTGSTLRHPERAFVYRRLFFSSERSRELAAAAAEPSAQNLARATDPALSRIRKRF